MLAVWSATRKVSAENEFSLILNAQSGLEPDRTS
jgi:hypothetical protein